MKGSSGWRIAIAGLLCASVCGVLLLGLWGRSFFSGSPATQRSEEAGSAGLSAWRGSDRQHLADYLSAGRGPLSA